MSDKFRITRRAFTSSALASTTLLGPALAQQTNDPILYEQLKKENLSNPETGAVKRNISGFSNKDWRPYFSNTKNGVILVDTLSRALHFWSEDQSVYRLYPTSVPETPELTRTGRTKITRKRVGPDWRPTPNMLKRNPEWPEYIPAGPDNPLGTHAMYLTWRYYRIHGTHDTRKIGRRSSSGCIGLFNEHIEELFNLSQVGTQVLLI
jgi:lipoprotein-anchoring transpeptidase ErfK/SrfK